MQKEKLVILDFGGKYRDLLARRVRELEIYCEVKPGNIDLAKIKEAGYQAIIISAAAPSEEQYNPDLKIPFDEIRALGLPVLAVNLSEDLLDKYDVVYLDDEDPSFSTGMQLFHISLAAKTDSKRLFQTKLDAFLKGRCRFAGNWRMDRYVEEQIAKIREEVGDSKVLCGLSGGVDSSVAALMVHKAVGKQLTCIFVDHGLMRKNEGDQVEKIFSEQFDVNFIRVNAEDRFLGKLAGVSDPEQKRKIIGEEFIRVFEEEALKFKDCDYLVQGTIYPDVIESGIGGAVIKSHHNVGGLPEDIQFKGLVEPLRLLFKDEVRKAGLVLGLPEELVWRQPFPGPGLAIRCLGEITKERLDILRDADAIFREEIINAGLHKAVGQYFAVLTNLRSVGVSTRGGQGDQRSYDYTLALRAVDTSDFMSAEWTKLPYGLLETCSSRIIREVAGINRVVYDITSKPPATIEWE